MNAIHIETILHDQQKYPTAGDYYWQDGDIQVRVSKLGNDTMEALIAIHEFVEIIDCQRRGIPLEASTDFDLIFEKEREEGKHSNDDEPGDAPDCPYRESHRLAENIERTLAFIWGIDWEEYSNVVGSLSQKKG